MPATEANPVNQYYVTAEIKPDGDIEVVSIEGSYGILNVAHNSARERVNFLRRVNQRRPPHGKLETKPLLRALAAWPLTVLKGIAGMRYGHVGDETEDMSRGLRPYGDDTDNLIMAVNRCALNEAGDDDRILLARKNKSGDTMIGPCELVECTKHPGQHGLHRWTWTTPSDGNQRSAIECGDGHLLRSCLMCVEEDEAAFE